MDEYECQYFWRKPDKFDKTKDILALAAWLIFFGLTLFSMVYNE